MEEEPSTDVETTPGHVQAVTPAGPLADYADLSEMGKWARDAQDVALIASKLVTTEFVPAAYKNKPAEATAAILTGIEVGLGPMASLRSIVSVNGTPAMVALALRGLVQSKGHRIWVQESNETRAIVCGQRRGDERIQESLWTIDRATKLGVAGKDNWRKQPQNMLIARATSEVARLIASDVLMGVPYSVEELEDDGPVPAGPPQSVKRPTSRVARKPLSPEPSEAEVPEAAAEGESDRAAVLDSPVPDSSVDDAEAEAARVKAAEVFADVEPAS